jgi:hypothetical protein
MSNSIIIVPYRNRAAHLAQFLSHMAIHYPAYDICVVEQEMVKPFNRGKLLNIGFLQNPGYRHYIFHDVDMLPLGAKYDTKYNTTVLQLARSEIQLFGYLGGVTRFGPKVFAEAGGYHNEYFHRAEDNEMRFNLNRLGINVIEKPQAFTMLSHERQGPEFDPALWHKAQIKREVQNQLKRCHYKVPAIKEFGNVRHIIVEL